MTNLFGSTRTSVQLDHALITPDSHVISPLIGWEAAEAVIHISPELGARFLQYTALLSEGAVSHSPGEGVERFLYVQEGSVRLVADGEHPLEVGGFAFVPADATHEIRADGEARLIVFEKVYQMLEGTSAPGLIVGNTNDIVGEPFQGNEDARLQTLLPIKPSFDMAVNIFTYQPGATLPQVEAHVMEHGMVMLAGQGVYRLGDSYYPVCQGDVMWMKSYCPQWFVAMGKSRAVYIYYKDIHRDGLVGK